MESQCEQTELPGAPELEIAPEALADRACAEPEIVRWVSRNIDNPVVDPEDCPDAFAWTLLRQCRANPAFIGFFIEKLWAKLLPSRSGQEKDSGDGAKDGAVTIEMIQRIQVIRDNAINRGMAQLGSVPDPLSGG